MRQEQGDPDASDPPPEPPGTVEGPPSVQVHDASGSLPSPDLAWLRRAATDAVRLAAARGEARVRVVHDDEMARLHARWRGEATTTDVLTFDLRAKAPPDTIDADLYICANEATRAATARGHHPRTELLLYIVHGVLHCLGYDDRDPAGAERMHAREDEILTAIGVGPVFDAGRARARDALRADRKEMP